MKSSRDGEGWGRDHRQTMVVISMFQSLSMYRIFTSQAAARAFLKNLFNNISFLIELHLVYHCPRNNYNNGVRLWNIAWQIILRVCQYGTAEGGSRTRKRNFKARPNKPPPEI